MIRDPIEEAGEPFDPELDFEQYWKATNKLLRSRGQPEMSYAEACKRWEEDFQS